MQLGLAAIRRQKPGKVAAVLDAPIPRRDGLLLLLVGLFVAALVVCNLIAQKFVTVDLGFREFVLSAGVLPYPVTFLITDLLSEVYGRRRANRAVWIGFVASVFVLGVVWLGSRADAIAGSPVDDATYEAVFGNAWRVIAASMVAYLVAQLVDIRLFHFWRRLTNGRHLWLRNNASTVLSQLVDTTLVVTILFVDDPNWPADRIVSAIIDGWMFKVLCAAADTPLFYLGTAWCRRHLAADDGQRPPPA